MAMRIPGCASPPARPCKVCDAPAALFGVVDFSKNCDEANGTKIPLSGHAIYYRRCSSCGFLFTDYFDDWSTAEFEEHIYNSGYAQVDPEYASVRPSANARLIAGLFGAQKDAISVLDFGGGNGQLAADLRASGFAMCATYDPLNPQYDTMPDRKYNLVTCFETLEHTPDPVGFVRAIAGCLEDEGLVLFSTVVQPANFDTLGLSWWYVGPRNGHISIHSPQSLRQLWSAQGYTVMSHNQNIHVAFRKVPGFAEKILRIA